MMKLMRPSKKNVSFWFLLIVVSVVLVALIWIRASSSKVSLPKDQRKVYKDSDGRFHFTSLKLKNLDGYKGKEMVLIGEISQLNARERSISLLLDSFGSSVEVVLPQNDFLISFSQPSSSNSGAYESTLMTSERLIESLGASVGKMVEARVLYELESEQAQELRRTCVVSVCAMLDMWSFYEDNNKTFFATPSEAGLRIGPMTQLFLGDN